MREGYDVWDDLGQPHLMVRHRDDLGPEGPHHGVMVFEISSEQLLMWDSEKREWLAVEEGASS